MLGIELPIFRKWRKQNKHRSQPDTVSVSEQVTDTTAADNLSLLGLNSAYSLDQTLMSQSQAHGTLFANMVSEQQRQTTAGQASAIKIAADIFGIKPEELAPELYSDD